MRYLIDNADAVGYSHNFDRCVVESHVHGILTSASLMVEYETPPFEAAAR